MRTPGQGQAAVPGERGACRSWTPCLGRSRWSVGKHLPDCHEYRGALSVSLWGWYVCGRFTKASFFCAPCARAL